MKQALSSCETSVLTRVTQRNSPEDAILHLPFLVYSSATISTSSKKGDNAGLRCLKLDDVAYVNP
jgi:hypothetical protein